MTARRAALALAALAAAMLAGAFGFEHVGGILPCVLCWWQRYAWFACLGLALAAAIAPAGVPRNALLALSGVAALGGAGVAGYHVGVEQGWWQGTAECGGVPSGLTPAQRLEWIMKAPLVRCTDIAWSMFGVSMAGWNGLIAAVAGAATLRVVMREIPASRR